MKIEIFKIQEPKLEFGNNKTSSFIKEALLNGYSTYESNFYKNTKIIRLGLIAFTDNVPIIRQWVDKLSSPILSPENNILKYPEYLGSEKMLNAKFIVDTKDIKTIDKRYEQSQALHQREKFNYLLDTYLDNIESLSTDNKPDCILVYFPEDVASLRVANSKLSIAERTYLENISEENSQEQLTLFELTAEEKKVAEELLPQAEELLFRNFHRALKAKSMKLENPIPIQVIRDRTFLTDRSSQSKSTIAWNISLGLYYKSGNIPWRLHDISNDTCFVGISFHHLKKRSGDLVYASVAQAFSSTGEGFALKGANIPKEQRRFKRPYLLKEQAKELIEKVLHDYRIRNESLPTRLVIHKTSRFEPEEIDGINEAIDKKIPKCDMIWFSPSPFRLLKRGQQPPERGTLCILENKEHFLFTTGYVSKWKEYPGPHIPSPLEIGATSSSVDLKQAAKEILALTKMNWNSSDGIGRFPITLSFARRVGMTMTELEDEESPNSSYKFYM